MFSNSKNSGIHYTDPDAEDLQVLGRKVMDGKIDLTSDLVFPLNNADDTEGERYYGILWEAVERKLEEFNDTDFSVAQSPNVRVCVDCLLELIGGLCCSRFKQKVRGTQAQFFITNNPGLYIYAAGRYEQLIRERWLLTVATTLHCFLQKQNREYLRLHRQAIRNILSADNLVDEGIDWKAELTGLIREKEKGLWLSLRNIGALSAAEVELRGLTVIAGENNTGKSTVGRALFTLCNAMYKSGDFVLIQVRAALEGTICRLLWGQDQAPKQAPVKLVDLVKATAGELALVRGKPHDEVVRLKLEELLDTATQQFDVLPRFEIEEIAAQIEELLAVSDGDIVRVILGCRIGAEYQEATQLVNLYKGRNASMGLSSENGLELRVTFDSHGEILYCDGFQESQTLAFLLDDPMVLDSAKFTEPGHSQEGIIEGFHYLDHRDMLLNMLAMQGKWENLIVRAVNIKQVSSLIADLEKDAAGDLVLRGQRFVLSLPGGSYLSAGNISAGLKTLTIVNTLLKGGYLDKGSVLILDEPEIHLHPYWQVKLARDIVLLWKRAGVYALVNTHSPYFVQALRFYTEREGLVSSTRYYQTVGDWLPEGDSGPLTYHLREVSRDLNDLFRELAEPLHHIMDVGDDVPDAGEAGL